MEYTNIKQQETANDGRNLLPAGIGQVMIDDNDGADEGDDLWEDIIVYLWFNFTVGIYEVTSLRNIHNLFLPWHFDRSDSSSSCQMIKTINQRTLWQT